MNIDNKKYSVKLLSCKDGDFAFVKSIRSSVFITEQGAIASEEFDDYDRKSTFLLLFDNQKAVGTARYVMTDKGFKIGRIAVIKDYRGRGCGGIMVRYIVEKLFEQGESFVLVDAQNHAVSFYEKLGFKTVGKEIIDRGLPHVAMKLEKEFYYGKG